MFAPNKVMLEQDSAPAHGAKKVQIYLKENLPMFVPKKIWPSISQDLNICDFWLFSMIEQQFNATANSSAKSLKVVIRRAFQNLDSGEVKRSCSAFR